MSRYTRSKSGKFMKKSAKEKLDKALASKREKLKDTSSAPNVCSGRRIVEVNHLAQELWCSLCDIPLSLRDIEEEQRKGLISVLKIQCRSCQAMKLISTRRRSLVEGTNAYDTNIKASIGLLDAGIGPYQFHTLLSALNIPTASEGLWKRHERLVGPTMEELAEESCKEAVALERSLTLSSPISRINTPGESSLNEMRTSTPLVGIAASYDMGWQKRGNGRSYDSMTGHASLIGLKSKKILNYGVRSKTCRRCNAGNSKKDHDCRKNFSGSAKSMESDLAVELVNAPTLTESNVQLAVLIGDDDSSTMSALKKSCNSDIEKWSDINHAKKSLVRMLYGLQKSHKEINSNVIAYLKRCFSYALEQNRYDIERTKLAILNIVHHAFDEHGNCGSWCKFLFNSETYKHKGLPGGKGLKGEDLKLSLVNVFKKFSLIADKLAPCGSSQQNESFNAMVAAKAPKSRHYGGSESLGLRVAAAVNQKNLGVTYLAKLHDKMGLSPGSHGQKQRKRMELKRTQKSINNAKLCMKRRRLFLKKEKAKVNSTNEGKEGMAYESGMGLMSSFSVPMKSSIPRSSKFVYLDTETSGFGKSAEICQIAAKCENTLLSMYVLPEKGINVHASQVTGLTIVGNIMYCNNIPVKTFSLKEALEKFLNFLSDIEFPVILLGHNLIKFDLFYLIRDIKKYSLCKYFENVVCGFVDTLPLLKKMFPGQVSYKQSNLVKQFTNDDCENAHNALYDVQSLNKLLDTLKVDQEAILSNAVSYEDYINLKSNKMKILEAKKTLQPLKGNVISATMVNKIASFFITLDDIIKIYNEGGEEGLKLLFCEDVGGKPRITKNKKILSSIFSFLKNL